jgi:predicted DNA-binding transcriptional regulator AlpA
VGPLTPRDVAELPAEMLPAALAEASAVVAAIAARLAQAPAQAPELADDRLLDVDQAAQVLGVSRDVMYGSKALRPLRVKIGGRVLFSSRGIQAWITRHAGRS